MGNLEEQMAIYAAYHQDPRNKATHFVGVPLIMLALLVPLSWLRIELAGFGVTGAMLFAAVVLAYYFILDVPLALAMLVVIAVLLWIAEIIAALPGYKPELHQRIRLSSSAHRAPSAP